jgi:hypothetical protein
MLPIKRGLLLRPGIWWGPVADGSELPSLPLTALRRGAFAKVPLIDHTFADHWARARRRTYSAGRTTSFDPSRTLPRKLVSFWLSSMTRGSSRQYSMLRW